MALRGEPCPQRCRRARGAGGRQAREGTSLVGESQGERGVARDARLELGAAARAQAVVGERDEIGLVGRMEFDRLGHPLPTRTPPRRPHSRTGRVGRSGRRRDARIPEPVRLGRSGRPAPLAFPIRFAFAGRR
jgi:hypothetical protein